MMKLDVPHLLPAMVFRFKLLYAVSAALMSLSRLKYLTCLSFPTLVCSTIVRGLEGVWVKYIGGGNETTGGRCGGAARGAAFRVRSVRNVIEK